MAERHDEAADADPSQHDVELVQVMRSARPGALGAGTLEKRLAVASIMAAAGRELEKPKLGRLEVQSRIGGGAMGVVYRAYDAGLQRRVAVKLLRSWTAPDERLRIVDEARRLAQLNHPHVVAVYDIVNDDDGLYFTMEYVAGTTLRAWLQAHAAASWREIVEWFVQAGRGLAAAHGAGMVHRDFKPENVLVGEDGRARVADFGLARVLHEHVAAEQAGTPHYMAPEVLAGHPATPASDQFAYCTALRDALAGKDMPAHVAGAVERGLEPEPARRHATLQALVDLLAGALVEGGDARPRALLLDRVERLWLRGVLEGSLGDGTAVDLPLARAPQLVAPPWHAWSARRGPAPERAPAANTAATSSRQVSALLAEGHGSLLVVGPPGAGKTTLLLLLCRDLWRTASLDPGAPAPAVLSLSTYRPTAKPDSDGPHFAAWVVDELVVKYGLPRPAVRRWLDQNAIVLLLDGLDETDPKVRARIVSTLERFRSEHALPVVVTCRDAEYEALGVRLAFGLAVAVEPLADASMTAWLEEHRASQLAERVARDPALRELLRNPLLLTLHASRSESDDLPRGPGFAQAYRPYVEAAWARAHAAERKQLEPQIAWLAGAMQRRNTSDLWLERLDFEWLDSRADNLAAYASGAVLVGLFSVGLNLAQVPYTGYPMASALVFGIGVWLSSFAYTRGRVAPVESLSWSWRRAARLAPITTACALIIGLIEALKVNFAANLAGAGITGAILALLFALQPGERATNAQPNAGVHKSLANALLVSFGSGVPVGLFFARIVQPYITHPLAVDKHEYSGDPRLIVGVAVGLFVFTAMFLIYGGFTAVMHYVLRLWLACRTPLPLDLVRLLDRAVDLGLMRRVGGGYMFLHRTLLDYFAEAAQRRGSR